MLGTGALQESIRNRWGGGAPDTNLSPTRDCMGTFTYNPRLFERIFINSEEEVLRYWGRVRCEDWFEAHPGRAAVEKRPQCALPLRIHGDDAPVSKGCSGLLLSFGSPLSYAESSFLSVFPLFYVLLRYILECSVDKLYLVIAWSVGCLLSGEFPETDWTGPL